MQSGKYFYLGVIPRKAFSIVFIILALGLSHFLTVKETQAGEDDVSKGQILYAKHCAVCHGSEGKGDGTLTFHPPVTDLTSSATQKQSDYELWKTIHEGGTHPVMKTWKWVLSEKDISRVLAYVRSLAQSSQPHVENKKF